MIEIIILLTVILGLTLYLGASVLYWALYFAFKLFHAFVWILIGLGKGVWLIVGTILLLIFNGVGILTIVALAAGILFLFSVFGRRRRYSADRSEMFHRYSPGLNRLESRIANLETILLSRAR
jgi:hypothetical protein